MSDSNIDPFQDIVPPKKDLCYACGMFFASYVVWRFFN